MGVFAYQAATTNKMVRGTIIADSPVQARERLRERGYRVRAIKIVAASESARSNSYLSFLPRRRPEAHVTAFVQELSTLLGAGIPILEGMEAIQSQTKGRFGACLMMMHQRISAGASFADTMREQPAVFDEISACMVDVGERTGTLDTVLHQLAGFRRRSEQLKGRIGTAMIYPAIVVCAGLAVIVFLSTFVVPKLLDTLIEAGQPLPWTTRVVKGFSDLLLHDGWIVASLVVAMIVGCVAALRMPAVRLWWDSVQLRLPIFGRIVRLQAVVRIAVLLSVLTRSGMEFATAVQLAANASRNLKVRKALNQCQQAIAAGRDIGPAMAETAVFPVTMIRILQIGQATGRLDEMLDRLATDYDLQVQTSTQRLLALMEPAMILLLAALIGFIVLSIILPYLEAGNVS